MTFGKPYAASLWAVAARRRDRGHWNDRPPPYVRPDDYWQMMAIATARARRKYEARPVNEQTAIGRWPTMKKEHQIKAMIIRK